MGRNIYQPEQIIAKLREAEVLLSKGQAVLAIVRRTSPWRAFALVCMSLNGAASSCKSLSATLDGIIGEDVKCQLG